MSRSALLAALVAAAAAFALYRTTLLPGVDFGDTGSFQTMVGSALITPRDAYPLYFAIGTAMLWLTKAPPAHALNLASAFEAAAACGLAVLVAAELSGSIAAALGVTLLFAASYTFWSQAVIAEVYSLHIALIALTLLLLLRWERMPTAGRLFAFFAVFAIGFGNHLSMILLLPGYTIFLLMAAPRGWRSMFAPSVVAMAAACAAAGAIQYAWNLRTLWLLPDPPHGIGEALLRFWFDVTKSDWRDTMVLNVPQSRLGDHLAMYWFDLRQQFGILGPVLAAVGLTRLTSIDRRHAVLLFMLFAVNVAFAYSYNVGDAHVFYLPSHFVLALLMAPALAWAGNFASRGAAIAGVLVTVYAGARAYRDFPALDRSHDRRPSAIVDALTAGLDDRRDILLTDLNWQIGNGLSYVAEVERPRVAYARLADVLWYAPALVADNRAIGRSVTATERARATLEAAYGPLFEISPDDRVPVVGFTEAIATIRPDTRYVLCVLKPSGELPVNASDLSRALTALTGGHPPDLPRADYLAVAGVAGQAPALMASGDRPFRRELLLQGVPVEIRMDSWLVSDTIRRMGFGHVVANRQHTLIVERGVSFVAFDDRGAALRTEYAANIYAPQPRYLIDSRRR
jgi:Protein O-mannosyl-transferase TMEM260-like